MNTSAKLTCLIGFLYCVPAYSDTAADPMLNYFDDVLKMCHAQLDIWRFSYRLQVGIAILVSVLGLVAAALQGSSASYVKSATVALGVVISAITIAVNTLEMNNYRQISISIDKVNKIVAKMETARLNYKTFKKPNNVLAADEFQKLYARYQAIIDPPETTPKVFAGYQLSLLPSAYADEAGPDWLRRLPDNPKNLYFVAVADSALLLDAQEESIRTAKILAIQFLRETLQTSMNNTGPVDQLADTLKRSVDEVDNYISYDEKTELYRYYSLVRVNRLQAESNTRYLYLKNGIESPKASFEPIIDVQRQNNDYAARRFLLQEQQIDQTSKMLSAQQYKKFSDARQARRADTPKQAIPTLKEVLVQQPEFYLGWFNLALAYSETEEDTSARQAYIRAVALEPLQPVRDSSIYNDYGYFLLARNEYCESTKLLEQALTLEPQNTVAQRNLEKARSEMLQGEIQCH